MSSIWDWSPVAANNANSDSAINWAEGQAPSTVNNSAREMMARVAEYLADNGGALVAGGTANVITVTANSAFTAYADGLILALRIATDNSAATTLNVNGIGAKSVRKMVGSGEVALSGAELQADGIYLFRYSTALNTAAGGWLLLNPTIDVPSFAPLASPALTGNPTAPTPTAGDNDTSISTTAFVTGAISTAITALSAVYQPLSAVLTALAGIGTAVAGDIIYSSGAGVWARRAKGTASQALLMNAGATAPAWATLPFTQSYDSGPQTITSAGSLTLAHGLGVQPTLYQAFIKCTTANIGYSIGDEVGLMAASMDATAGSKGLALWPDATNINVRFGQNAGGCLQAPNKSSGAVTAITNGSWALIVRAWA